MHQIERLADTKLTPVAFGVAGLFLAAALAAPAAAAEPAPLPAIEGPIAVIDGDTVEAGGRRWRLAGIDAPEIHRSACALERERGIRGAARLIEMLARHGGRIEPEATRTGRVRSGGFGRGLGRLVLGDGRGWGEIAIAEGHAVAWEYGRSPRPTWCTPPGS